jgi:hypothetical protein
MKSRNIFIYVFIETFLSFIAIIFIKRMPNYYFAINLIICMLYGYVVGALLELLYITIQNPPQIKEFFKLKIYFVSLNNLAWLQCTFLGLCFEIRKYSKKRLSA